MGWYGTFKRMLRLREWEHPTTLEHVIAREAWTIMSFSSITQPLGGR